MHYKKLLIKLINCTMHSEQLYKRTNYDADEIEDSKLIMKQHT